MKLYFFIIFILISSKIFSLDIVVYENPPIFHSKSTINIIEEKKKNLIEFKKYDKSCNIQCMLSESLYQSYLYYFEKKNNILYLYIYETKTGNKIYSFNKKIEEDTFEYLMLKGNTLVNLYDYNVIDIFQAIDEENIKLLKHFVKNIKNLKKLNGLNMTPLNYALFQKKYSLIKYLLKNTNAIYMPDSNLITPLHRIAQWGNIKLFKKYYFSFLNYMKSDRGNNFLHYALKSGNIKLINFLLKNGFSLRDKNKLNKNSLDFVVESGNIEAFNFVLEKNKDYLLQITKLGRNILHFTSRSGNFKLFKRITNLLKEKKFNIENHQFDNYHRNYIYYSVIGNKEGYIKKFLDLGQKFELDNSKNSALHYAVKENKINSIRDLISLGLDLKQKNNEGATPVLLGFRYLNLKNLKELLTDLTFTDLKDKNGLTPLHYAVLGNKFKTINYLFANGIDINTKSKYGENALFFAILNRSESLFLYLYYRGVSSNIRLKTGETLLHIAAQEKNEWFFNFLLNHNEKIYTQNKRHEFPLDIAIKENNLSVIKSINNKHKVEFYRPDIYSNRALEKIILWNHKKLFDYLLKENIRYDLPNINGECALDIAIKAKRRYMISELTRRGAIRCKK